MSIDLQYLLFLQKLREMTGAGLADCKKALAESEDMDGAVAYLRKKGQAVAAKRSDREASEGCVLVKAENGFGAIIAAAGKAAHLAGAIAANTTLPVIGIPVKSSTLDGLDALLSTVQMPAGIPVATVAIDGAANAALLAVQILSVSDDEAALKLDAQRKTASENVLKKNADIEKRFNK